MAGQDWRKNKKGFMVNPEGKTARQVRAEKRAAAKAVEVEVITEGPKKGKSRIGKLIDSLEENQKADLGNFKNILSVADRANKIITEKTNQAPSRKDAKGNSTPNRLSGSVEGPKKGRFGSVVDKLADIDKADLKNAAKTYGATAELVVKARQVSDSPSDKTKIKSYDESAKTPKRLGSTKRDASKASGDGGSIDIADSDIAKEPQWKFYRLDFENISPSGSGSFSKRDIEERADRIVRQGGLASPLLVEQIGVEKYRTIGDSDLDLAAARRAFEKNPNLEAVNSIVVPKKAADLAREQFEIFGRVKTDRAGKIYSSQREGVASSGFVRIDIGNISAPDRQFSQKEIQRGAKSILRAGGLLTPVIVKRTGFEQYELVDGHKAFQAAKLAFKRAPTAETINVIIVE